MFFYNYSATIDCLEIKDWLLGQSLKSDNSTRWLDMPVIYDDSGIRFGDTIN